jgi:hypothetical protein
VEAVTGNEPSIPIFSRGNLRDFSDFRGLMVDGWSMVFWSIDGF